MVSVRLHGLSGTSWSQRDSMVSVRPSECLKGLHVLHGLRLSAGSRPAKGTVTPGSCGGRGWSASTPELCCCGAGLLSLIGMKAEVLVEQRKSSLVGNWGHRCWRSTDPSHPREW
jgi:hypothetical protein